MFKKVFIYICMALSLSGFAQTHKIPTTDGTNNFTGINTFLPGNLQLTSPIAGCTSGQVMRGIDQYFNPICVSVGSGNVASIQGQTGAVTLQSSGATVTITVPSSGVINLEANSSAGSGTVSPFSQYQDAFGPSSGTSATVGPLANKYTFPLNLSSTTINTFLSGVASSSFTIQNGDSTTPFSNPNFNLITDLRQTYPTTDWNVKWSGAQCDLQGGFASLTEGNSTITLTSGYSFTSADVGKYVEMVGFDTNTNLPSRFDPTIVSITDSTHAVLSTNAPFSVSQYSMDIGHRDDAAIAAAFGEFSYTRPIEFPVGNCWSDTVAVYGQSFHGKSATRSLVTGLAGDDVFSGLDPTYDGYQGMSAGMQIHDMKWEFDPRINASQPWEDVSANGTVTAHAATYRPEGIFTVWANNPLGPGWVIGTGPNNTGAINGVATTNGTTSITITSAAVPGVGDQIVFPYSSTGVFVTTVSSVSGSTVVLANAYPVSGSQTQQEWMSGATPGSTVSGTAVQEIETNISSSYSFSPTVLVITQTSKTGTTGTYTFTLTSGNSPSAGQIVTITGTTNGGGIFNGIGSMATVVGSTFTIDGFPSGTISPAAETGAATAPALPLAITLANPITPPLTLFTVSGTASNFAPYGLVQIGSEQFSYFGDSNYPATVTPTPIVYLTGRAQNGTSAASHSVGDAIVPLNPFQPTWPWPVTPSINAGVTPANAVYFPAWDIGNAGWSQPVYNGNDWASNGALSYAVMHDITISIADFGAGSGGGVEGGPNAFQVGNATAGMYITTSTFKSKFENIRIINPQFGIFEGTPSTNVYGIFSRGYPTANGSTWDNITIQSAGYVSEFIEAQNDIKTNFLTFCQNGGETGTSNPEQTLGVVGCGAGWSWGGTYDEKDGGGGSDNSISHFDNWYIEAEDGLQNGMQPAFEINCTHCHYGTGFSMGGGGQIFIEGNDNQFEGGQVIGEGAIPIINYGYATTMQFVSDASSGGVSNIYGVGGLLNYGANSSMSGRTDGTFGPLGAIAAGNNLAPVTGQTAEMFATGNDLGGPEYVSGNSALLFPDQLPLGDWIFDDTAPVSHSYSSCAAAPGTGCTSYQFNQNSRVVIGPDQKIAPGKYIVHYAFKGTVATSFFFELDAVNGGSGACSGGGALLILNPTLTTSWVQGSAPIDFTNASTCDLQMSLHNSTLDTVVEMGYLIFTPVNSSLVLPVTTPTEGDSCPIPGSFLGSDSSYIYICASGGTVKRAGIS